MKVGFYIGDVDLRSGGIAPYAQRVLSALAAHPFSSDVELCVIGRQAPTTFGLGLPFIGVPVKFKPPRIERLRRRAVDAYNILTGNEFDSNRHDASYSLGAFLDELNLDVLHVPYQVPPSYELNVPLAVTMHDVQEIHLPQFFTAEDRRDRAIWHLRAIRQAAVVVVSFEHVKQDLIRYFSCPEEQVVVVPLPIEQCSLQSPSPAESKQYRQKYARYPDFFLYPAQTWEHKNHLRLIEAFGVVRRRTGRPLSLICTGRKNGFYSRIESTLRDSPVADQILFTDVVPEVELRWLYERCLGVVIPTLYEAGSFPLIEAMQIGAAVVCAEITSLPETIGDRQFLFDPRGVEQIATAMTRLASDAAYRDASIANGQRRLIALSQQDVGAHYEALWRKAARRDVELDGTIHRMCA